MEATFYTRDVYGQPLRYPVNSTALMACDLAGTKTITDHVWSVLAFNEVTITEVFQPR